MKRFFMVIAALSSVALLAQTQSRPQFSDKNQRFALWFSDFSIEYPDKDTTVFDVSGSPAHGYSRTQNLQFSATNLTGKLVGSKSGEMKLRSGTASGNAVVTVEGVGGSSVFRSAKISITNAEESATVTVPGSFSFTNAGSSKDGARTIRLTGSKGTFQLASLDSKSDDPLQSADVSGPVELTFSELNGGLAHKTFELTAQNLTGRSQGSNRVFTAQGNVHISGDVSGHDNFVGDMYVAQAIVTVDQDLNIKSIRTKAPGTANLSEKKEGS